jgi:hypothetical protein
VSWRLPAPFGSGPALGALVKTRAFGMTPKNHQIFNSPTARHA